MTGLAMVDVKRTPSASAQTMPNSMAWSSSKVTCSSTTYDPVYSGPLPPIDVAEAMAKWKAVTQQGGTRHLSSHNSHDSSTGAGEARYMRSTLSWSQRKNPSAPLSCVTTPTSAHHLTRLGEGAHTSGVRRSVSSKQLRADSTYSDHQTQLEARVNAVRRLWNSAAQQAKALPDSKRARALRYWSTAVVNGGSFQPHANSSSEQHLSKMGLHSTGITRTKSFTPGMPGQVQRCKSSLTRHPSEQQQLSSPQSSTHSASMPQDPQQQLLLARLEILEHAVQLLTQNLQSLHPATANATHTAAVTGVQEADRAAAPAGQQLSSTAVSMSQMSSTLMAMQQELVDLRAMQSQSASLAPSVNHSEVWDDEHDGDGNISSYDTPRDTLMECTPAELIELVEMMPWMLQPQQSLRRPLSCGHVVATIAEDAHESGGATTSHGASSHYDVLSPDLTVAMASNATQTSPVSMSHVGSRRESGEPRLSSSGVQVIIDLKSKACNIAPTIPEQATVSDSHGLHTNTSSALNPFLTCNTSGRATHQHACVSWSADLEGADSTGGTAEDCPPSPFSVHTPGAPLTPRSMRSVEMDLNALIKCPGSPSVVSSRLSMGLRSQPPQPGLAARGSQLHPINDDDAELIPWNVDDDEERASGTLFTCTDSLPCDTKAHEGALLAPEVISEVMSITQPSGMIDAVTTSAVSTVLTVNQTGLQIPSNMWTGTASSCTSSCTLTTADVPTPDNMSASIAVADPGSVAASDLDSASSPPADEQLVVGHEDMVTQTSNVDDEGCASEPVHSVPVIALGITITAAENEETSTDNDQGCGEIQPEVSDAGDVIQSTEGELCVQTALNTSTHGDITATRSAPQGLPPPSDLRPTLQPLPVPVPTMVKAQAATPALPTATKPDSKQVNRMQPLETEWDPLMSIWSKRWGS